MNQLIAPVFHLSASASAALVSAIWEGALLAALVLLVLRLLPGLTAAARSVIWLNVFVLLAALHFLPLVPGASDTLHASAHPALRLNPGWSVALAALWLSASLFRAVQLLGGVLHIHRLGRRATLVPAGPELQPLLMHHGHPVELCASAEVTRPSVLGFLRPRILVPPALIEELSPGQLRQVVVHEMEHLHRADDWTNLLQKIALVLFPLNPALLWVERRLCAERELACDDRVLHSGSGRKAYALCLTHLAEYALVRRGFSLVLGAWERRPELVRRVHRILREPARSMGRRPALVAMSSLTVGALACTLLLAHAPQLVRFAPRPQVAQQARSLAPLDARELGRELGGTPRFVKAVLPQPNQPQPVHRAVGRRPAHRAVPATRLAALRTPPPPMAGTLMVLTEWIDSPAPPQVVFAFAETPQVRTKQAPQVQTKQPSPPVRIYATYAVVSTPDGWLVIQI
ncbi:MAG TPA: M56 family metallopeptidase [Terracidiphilus sp.]|jgi:hypothetical protein|nr:M56 family metallopeptidase [Terracidiphilus sp.]